jgi:hypothetical protein
MLNTALGRTAFALLTGLLMCLSAVVLSLADRNGAAARPWASDEVCSLLRDPEQMSLMPVGR